MRIFHKIREKYNLDDSFFNESGFVEFTDLQKARIFAQKINQQRDLEKYPEAAVKASEINGIVLENEIIFYLLDLFQKERKLNIIEEILDSIEDKIGTVKVNKTLKTFIEEFPPSPIFNKEINSTDYLMEKTEKKQNKHIVISSIIDLHLSNANPAVVKYSELFSDKKFETETSYSEVVDEINRYLSKQPPFGPDEQNILEMLTSIAEKNPKSIQAQLEFILEKWGTLTKPFQSRILQAIDFIKEEEKFRGIGPGESQVIEFDYLDENYTQDREWMPQVVLLAKNIYVWLDQLSDKYNTHIEKIDQIPNAELEQLVSWGFNALWLIGIWERSSASKTIKQWCGNPEAEASAYSVYDYVIANDLGGEEALQNLRRRARDYGIRLASDMVPNHMAIDSKWMKEHPDWFISLPYCPFPSYSYSGESLSRDPRYGIYLEDHYFSRTDAAVTFKWVNNDTGEVRYIYHGNDGTSMPWNDTAQINFLKPEVREAVIQTILHVSRMFPIIRFDAAMTLTKKHYHRLWFPAPGSGGDIPSRVEHGLSREEFNKAMPQEFWREVVERIKQETPDTLLLAEAFWLLEGYFVRALGMHRVYNSAFMNMLRDEDNANYRSVIKNTLEYDPEILQRFVNFMNNPDEETAVHQFGKGEKYFGIAILLVTMPGLPMFGHGQIEGFAEKYGMEYRRAYWNEKSDLGFIKYHEKTIFPLMKRRNLFAGVKNFYLYDFFTFEGHVNEDVFAFSNNNNKERALVIYHNKYTETKGWIKTSVAFMEKNENRLKQVTLGEGLKINNEKDCFIIFRDQINGLEYIRNCNDIYEKGLFLELKAYQSSVFIDFREVHDNDEKPYSRIYQSLNGKGVMKISDELKKTFKPVVKTKANQLFLK